MEPVRTPSQSVVIFMFLMITLFTYQGKDTNNTYTEPYQKSEKSAAATVSVKTTYYQIPKKSSQSDTLYHDQQVNNREEKRLRNRFSISAYPVSLVQSTR
jgi:hypothetical protein